MIAVTDSAAQKLLRVLQACHQSAQRAGTEQFQIDDILRSGGSDYSDLLCALVSVEDALAAETTATGAAQCAA